MSRTQRANLKGGGRQRHISVRAVRRDPPDLQKLSRAIVQQALEQAAAEAAAQAQAKSAAAPTGQPELNQGEPND